MLPPNPAAPRSTSAIARRRRPPRARPRRASTSSEAQIALVAEAIEAMRPRFQCDGGDIELDRVEENTVFVRMTGTCVACQLAAVSVSGVQMKLIEAIGVPVRVIPVGMGRS